jgi:Uma2 family endonuclease
MSATIQAPVNEDTLKMAFESGDSLVKIPATLSEYWQLIELPQYRLDYINKHIYATMSYGSLPHETIISNLIFQLNYIFGAFGYRILPSNRPIYAENCGEIYQPDVHIVKGDLQIYEYDKSKTATKNPILVVEVLSKSNRNYDIGEKLECYQLMPSVENILYVDSTQYKVTVYKRTSKPNQWLKTEYLDMNQKVKILNKNILLSKIYKDVEVF